MFCCKTNDKTIDNSLVPTVLVLTFEIIKDHFENLMQSVVLLPRKMHEYTEVWT